MITVVMPVYNCAEHLREAIESVLTQTYETFEFIIYDDGSTDETPEIISSYKARDSRIRVITGGHQGISNALNTGICAARFDIIARMDGDDICETRRFEKQLQYMEANPKIDLLGTYISEVLGNAPDNVVKKKLNGFNRILDEGNIEYFLLNDYLLFHPSWMFKKKIFNMLGGYRSFYDGAEDYDFLLRAFTAGYEIRNLPEGLMKLRLTKDSASRADYGGRPDSVRKLIHIKLDYLDKKINFNQKRIAIWGTGVGGGVCAEVLQSRYPDIKLICFYDKTKEGFFRDVPVYKTRDIDFKLFDLLIGATEPGKPDIFKFMEENQKRLYRDFIILVW